MKKKTSLCTTLKIAWVTYWIHPNRNEKIVSFHIRNENTQRIRGTMQTVVTIRLGWHLPKNHKFSSATYLRIPWRFSLILLKNYQFVGNLQLIAQTWRNPICERSESLKKLRILGINSYLWDWLQIKFRQQIWISDFYKVLIHKIFHFPFCRRKWRLLEYRGANEGRGGKDQREGGGNHRGPGTRDGHPDVGPRVHHHRRLPDHPRHLRLLHPPVLPQETLQRRQEGHERSRPKIGTIIRFSIQRKGIQ